MNKQQIIAALRAFITQRPRLDFANYGHVPSYRADARKITQHLADARALLRIVELSGAGSVDEFHAASRRIILAQSSDGDVTVDFTPCQYWPIEYRANVARMCADVLWAYWRDHCGMRREQIQKQALALLGRGITARWFN